MGLFVECVSRHLAQHVVSTEYLTAFCLSVIDRGQLAAGYSRSCAVRQSQPPLEDERHLQINLLRPTLSMHTLLRNNMSKEIVPTRAFRTTRLFHCLSSHSVLRSLVRSLSPCSEIAARCRSSHPSGIEFRIFCQTSKQHYCSSIPAIIRCHCRYSTTQRHSH